MQPVLPTGCLTRKSCPATTANVSSLPSCQSTTAAPAAKECVTTAPRSAVRFRRGAGTTPCACAPAATRTLENFNRDGLPSSESTRENHSLTQLAVCHCFTSVTLMVLSCICGKEVFRHIYKYKYI